MLGDSNGDFAGDPNGTDDTGCLVLGFLVLIVVVLLLFT